MNYLNRLFGFDPTRMTLKEEIIGGITTFLTMSYILAVQPAMLSKAGIDAGAVFTSTILSSVIATVCMAVYAKLPFALAPAMGASAFLVFTIILGMGYSWQFALTAVFIEGLLFILLTVTGLRTMMVEAMPLKLRQAIVPGIGLFITFIGMQNAGIVVCNESTLVGLGDLRDTSVWLACFGVLLTAALQVRKVTGALLGSSTISTFVESASGVNVGGRSGLTAMVTAVCFLLSLFLAPLFLSIPAVATAPVLILVGVMMMGNMSSMDFGDYLVAVPCFLCIVVMPFTCSIADGILLGIISWVTLHLLTGHAKQLSLGTVILALLFVMKYLFL